MRTLVPALLLLLLLPALAFGEDRPGRTAPTQADLIVGLVDSLGWTFGLPDKPEVEDYLAILRGRRVWRFEIEDIYVPGAGAPLAPKEITTFGPFSGKVWQRAPSGDIDAELKFLLPISGTYEIRVGLTMEGYRFRIGEQEFSADGERDFSEVSFGAADLTAGMQSATLSIPARGGVDYLLLVAPPAPAVEPLGGWSPESRLTTADLAVVVSRLLNLEPFLPPGRGALEIEAEIAPTPPDATLSGDRFYGPVQGEWVNAGMNTAHYSHLFEVDRAGFYRLSLFLYAREPVSGLINGRHYFSVTPRAYFAEIDAGTFYLDAGVNQIDVDLPSRSGFDRFRLQPKASTAADLMRLTGLAGKTAPTSDQLDDVLRLLAAIGARR